MMRGPRRRLAVLAAGLALAGGVADAQDRSDTGEVVAAIGRYVEQYFAAARTVIARESVTLQPLGSNLRPEGRARTLVYDVRVEWERPASGDPAPPRVERHLVEVDGRTLRPGEDAACLAADAPDPLAFLLPQERGSFTFGRVRAPRGDAPLLSIEYAPVSDGEPSVVWRGDCGTLDVPGHVRGRLLVDPSTFAVHRLESSLRGPVAIPVPPERRRDGWGGTITAERIDLTFVYAPVTFPDPDETLLLPSEIETVTVVRTPEPRRLRATQRFSEYRRFSTTVRVVPATP